MNNENLINTDELHNVMSIKAECNRCAYIWHYDGAKVKDIKDKVEYPVYTSCPRCRTLVRLNKK